MFVVGMIEEVGELAANLESVISRSSAHLGDGVAPIGLPSFPSADLKRIDGTGLEILD